MVEKDILTQPLSGFMELLPEYQVVFNKIKDAIREVYESFGFSPLDTPVVERANVLLAKAGGDTQKEVYRLKKGENDLALRFDLTVPLARYVSNYYNDLIFPFKRYQIGKVFRGERAQKGRFREFYQCDIDVIGDGELSLLYDAEMPAIIYKIFRKIGLPKFTVRINNRKILGGLFTELGYADDGSEILRIVDKIEKIGKDEVKSELGKLGLGNEAISKIISFIEIDGSNADKIAALNEMDIKNKLYKEGIRELEEVVGYLPDMGMSEDYYHVDLTIARGLGYYTGTVYETFLDEAREIGSLCSGGRYDDLAEYYSDKKLPGVGISIGMTRMFYKLVEAGIVKSGAKSNTDVLIIPFDGYIPAANKAAVKLRKSGLNVLVYMEEDKIKKKFKYSDRADVPYVMVVGEDEVKSGKYALKDMCKGKQDLYTLGEIADLILSEK